MGVSDTDLGSAVFYDVQADNVSVSMDWIAVGTDKFSKKRDWPNLDNNQYFENVLQGTWAPFALCRDTLDMPGAIPAILDTNTRKQCLENISSVYFVITPNKNEWTRCAVVETGYKPFVTDGVDKLDIKPGASLGKDFKPDGSGTGLSWFPGYALDMNTGERLNIIFGENSYYGENGKDMIWNPSAQQVSQNGVNKDFYCRRPSLYIYNGT